MSTLREKIEEIVTAYVKERKFGSSVLDQTVKSHCLVSADLAMRLIVEELRSQEAMVFQLEHEERNQDWVVIPPGEWASWLEARWQEKGKE